MIAALRRNPGVLAWMAYLIVPVTLGGFVHGVPLGIAEAAGLCAVTWLLTVGRRVSGGAVVGAVLATSLAVSVFIDGRGGFRARYHAEPSVAGAFERGTEFPRGNYTRIDPRLSFGMGGPDLPLAFLNDIARFNFYHADEPDRRLLGVAAEWNGYWWVDADMARRLYVFVPGGSATIRVDLEERLNASDGLHVADVTLARGWHRLDVEYVAPYGAPRQFEAGWIDGEARHPFDASAVFTRETGDSLVRVRRVAQRAKQAVDILALGWLAWLVGVTAVQRARGVRWADGAASWRRQLSPLLALVAIAEAFRFAWPWATRFLLMRAGDDPMTYESSARDILLNGPWMTMGLPLGQGDPFYYQALYPYFLAVVHALSGEGMFGVLLAQRLLVAAVAWLVAGAAVLLAGEAVWLPALAWAVFVAYWKFAPIAADLLNESLFIPLLMSWLVVLLRVMAVPTGRGAVGAGLLGGVTSLARSTTVSVWVVLVPAFAMAWRGIKPRWAFIASMTACGLVVFSLMAVRNLVVAHRLVFQPTGGGITMLSGNEPPEGLAIDPARHAQLYDALGLDDNTRRVAEFAFTAPGAFAANMARKTLFALGYYDAYAPGWGMSPVYLIGLGLALWGMALVGRRSLAPPMLAWLPAIMAVAQVAAVIIVYPKGERLILPFHMLMAPYAGVALARLVRSA